MSQVIYSVVECDKCEHEYRGQSDIKTRHVRALAKENGWKLGKKRDLCPKCSAELSAKAKEVLAGNI